MGRKRKGMSQAEMEAEMKQWEQEEKEKQMAKNKIIVAMKIHEPSCPRCQNAYTIEEFSSVSELMQRIGLLGIKLKDYRIFQGELKFGLVEKE